jgi:hypothetical protein
MTAKPLRKLLADKPELVVHTADLTVTARALAKLLAEKCHTMFVQNGKPVLVVVDNDGAGPNTVSVAPGTVINRFIRQLTKRFIEIERVLEQAEEIGIKDKASALFRISR